MLSKQEILKRILSPKEKKVEQILKQDFLMMKEMLLILKRKSTPHRDPLAQSFTIPEGSGVFLTEFDLFFKTVDPDKKCFIELREMELELQLICWLKNGVIFLSTQMKLTFHLKEVLVSVATRIKFPSPTYLEGG